LVNEKEKIDLNWQTLRKHAKREYMRQLSQYEEVVGSSTATMVLTPLPDHVLGSNGIGRRRPSMFRSNPQKPEEPDWQALRIAFDQDAGLDRLESVQSLRNNVFMKSVQVIRAMRAFVDKIELSAVSMVFIQS
jgi:hypothetical protein